MTKRYWRFEIEPDDKMMRRSRTELGEELVETLERAVKRRLMADVPLGVFSAAESTPPRWRRWQPSMSALNGCALSVSDLPNQASTSPLSGRAAKFLGTDHRCEILDLDKACDVLPGILRQVDEPQGDNSLLPTWLLSRFTRQHVTVALGGDGGDELFAGYDTFRGLGWPRGMRASSRALHGALRALAGRLPVSHANLSMDFKIKRGMRGASHQARYWNAVWLGALEPAEIGRLFGETIDVEELYSEAVEAWDSCRQKNLVDRTLQFYTELYLQDGILAKA